MSAGTVTTMGASASTPGVPAKASWMRGRLGAMSTAASTDMQAQARRMAPSRGPAGRPVRGLTTTAGLGVAGGADMLAPLLRR